MVVAVFFANDFGWLEDPSSNSKFFATLSFDSFWSWQRFAILLEKRLPDPLASAKNSKKVAIKSGPDYTVDKR